MMGCGAGIQFKPNNAFRPSLLSGCVLHLDAQQLALGSVAQWNDLSGTGNHATQATSTARPVNTASQINGKNAVVFDGVDDNLVNVSLSISQPLVAFVVARHTVNATDQYIYDGTGSRCTLYYSVDIPGIYSGLSLNSGTASPASFELFTATHNTTSSSLYKSGALAISGDSGSLNFSGLIIGSRFNLINYISGAIAELIFYNRAITTAERQRVEEYLRAKYTLY